MSQQSFDVVIVGGAAVGSAVAYFLTSVLRFGGSVACIERDATFRSASTALSAASIRQQFSTPENIRLSRFGLQFLREMPELFGSAADPAFREGGYLILVPDGALPILQDNYRIQVSEGADIALLEPYQLGARFPWLDTEGLSAGSLGLSGEGWFDAHTLLRTLRSQALAAGTHMISGEVCAVERGPGKIEAVRLASGERIGCGILVNAAGPAAGQLAAMAGRPLPVEARKRTVFVVDCPTAPRDMPLVADPAGFWIRPEGGGFLTGFSPAEADDRPADADDLEPDHAIFADVLWPALASRIPCFETLKVTAAWGGHYDYNVFDQNGIVGRDPVLPNFIYANGFSGHGLQQSPAVGRAVAELIAHGSYQSIDLAAFGYERIAAGRPVVERNVI